MSENYHFDDNCESTAVLEGGHRYIRGTDAFRSTTSDFICVCYATVDPEFGSAVNGNISTGYSLQEEFDRLANAWQQETMFLSSTGEIIRHRAHLEIIGMGPKVVPHILRRMRERPGLWFQALHFLTGDNPVQEESRGDIEAMTQAWIDWGRERGYC